MNDLKNFERNIKKMNGHELLLMYSSLIYNDTYHHTKRNDRKISIVENELETRLEKGE